MGGEEDPLKAKAAEALGDIDVPTHQDIISAAEAVVKAAEKAKQKEDTKIIAASRGSYIPEEADFSWIVPYYEKFHERWPTYPAVMADELSAVRDILVSGRTNTVNTLTPLVEDWSGKARDSFYKYFLVPFPNAIKNQTEVVDELRSALWAYEAVLSKARIDAKEIAKQTENLLESLDDFKSSDATLTLAVVGAAAAVIGTIATGGILGLALVSAGASVASASISAAKDIDGHDVNSVLESMKNTLDDLETAMDEEETNIGKELAKSNTKVDDILNIGTSTPGNDEYLTRTTLLPAEPDNLGDQPKITDGNPDNDKPEFQPPQ